jgi:serine protease Do
MTKTATLHTTISAVLCSVLIVFSTLPAEAQLFGRKEKEIEKPAPESMPSSFADLAEALLPSVVNISSTQKVQEMQDMPEMPQFPPGSPFEDFFEEFMKRRDGRGMPALPPASLGSGFIVDSENGYIITNNHVIRDAEEVRVTFSDDTTLPAEIIGMDEKTDIAVLKVDTDKQLTAVKFGNSNQMRVGDWVLAIGNPFGLGGTVTAGIVSARQRDINAGPYDDFIQTDASINRGNSGGPMFNTDGEVIGINTAIFSPSGGSVGIGFAIPSGLANPVVDQIIKYGRTRRGWLGVRIQSVTEEIAESLGLKDARGALIASVNQDGPAKEAGLKPGDVILSFNNQDVSEMRELPRIVAETEINTSVPLVFWRDGQEERVNVKIGELEKAEEDGLIAEAANDNAAPEQGETLEPFNLTVSKINDILRAEFMVPDDVNGVVITAVPNNSPAAEKGLMPGDVIVEVNQQPVASVQELRAALQTAQEEDRPSVLFLLNREGSVRFTALKFPEDKQKEEE